MFGKLRRKVADFSGKAKLKAEQVEQRVELERGKMDARQLQRLKKQREKAEAKAKRAEMKNIELRKIQRAERTMEQTGKLRRGRQMRRVQRRARVTEQRERITRARQRARPSGYGTRPVSRPVRRKASKQKFYVKEGVAYPVAQRSKTTKRATRPTRQTRPSPRQRPVRSKPKKKTKWI